MSKPAWRIGQGTRRGEWQFLVRVYLGRTATGRRKYHNKTIHDTRKDAQAYLNQALRDTARGRRPEPEDRQRAAGPYVRGAHPDSLGTPKAKTEGKWSL